VSSYTTQRTPPDRQRTAAIAMIQRLMRELLQYIDLDYYRSTRLLIVRAEVEQLRKGRSKPADVQRQKVPRITKDREA
jgi:hypothetical protein